MSSPAMARNSSIAMCGWVPTPAEPKLNLAGFLFFTPAMKSFSVPNGSLAGVTSMLGDETSWLTGAKSRRMSNFTLGLVAGRMVIAAAATSSV